MTGSENKLSPDLLKEILTRSLNEIYVFDADTLKFLFVNEGAYRNLGYSLDELYNLTPYDIKPGFTQEAFRSTLEPLLTKELDQLVFESMHRRKDGSEYPVDVHLQMMEKDGGQVFLAIINDITERRQTEDRLHKLNRVYTLLSEVNQAIVRIREPQALFEDICRIAVEKGGFRMAWIGIADPSTQKVDAVACAGVTNGYIDKLGIILSDELRGNGPTGRALRAGAHVVCNDIKNDPRMGPWREDAIRIGYRSSAALPLNVAGRLKGVLNLYSDKTGFFDEEEVKLLDELAMDISFAMEVAEKETERRKAEDALKESEARYRGLSDQFSALLDAIPDNLTLQAPDLTVLWSNKGAANSLGKKPEELVGRHCYELWHQRTMPCEICPVQQSFTTGLPFMEIVTTPDGRIWELRGVPIKKDGKVTHVIELGKDITEKIRLEKQLLHAQKMETVGTLAGGVAHDFNNILTAIIGYGQVALMKMPKDDPNRKYIESMLEASDRAANLTGSLLAFSRKGISDKRPVELNAVIKDVGKLLRRVISEGIELKTECGEGEITVLADRNQLEQVLMNLAVNARDAMPDGGTFTITTAKTTIDEGFVKAHGYGRPGTYALITVSDTGIGMDEETLGHIFEPFFTTKEVGKGTGLGLSVVYGIVKQHDGFINCYSEPGNGTTFRIYLPAIQPGAIDAPHEETQAVGAASLQGTETILLAEDDDGVRGFTKTMLTDAGYKVIEAVDGEDAVRKFMENKDAIRLLIFDLIMPKKTGNEAYNEIKGLAPQIKAIFVTGYSPELAGRKTSPGEGVPVVYKPISPKDLLREVRGVLG
ncbi:hybrid sensor histidine kinase/response regulator [Dissulfurimicrobium hydrothermale]|uniref:hybrid sensor histidine kinase/response regulator n=1 Tax=Dissulfurimicrobium hydrothermale TaxID=1750598 RepID=UPI001EDA1117|nr:GAF domain-containing protein [Dissulfurimicrobium hydrothermale]UKL14514.1 GAF domain-containing protein [Dissulfurimicrobium hydrothermale]